MELNKECKQIFLNEGISYDTLKGKVADKVGFTNWGDYGQNMCIVTFTDKTFIALGVTYNSDSKWESRQDEPLLINEHIIQPQNWNSGNFKCHMTVINGEVRYDPYIRILRDFGIWKFTDEEELAIIEKQKKDKEDYEYKEYLRLREKFEK